MIFSRVGRVGSAALAERKHNGWIISGQTLRIRFENPEMNPKFLNYFIQSNIFNSILQPELLGTTRDSINTTVLENIPVIQPSRSEQDKIVDFISEIDNKISEQKIKSCLEQLKNGLMQKLLTGKIRVKL